MSIPRYGTVFRIKIGKGTKIHEKKEFPKNLHNVVVKYLGKATMN